MTEPHGPLSPDERRRAQDLLSKQQFLAYKHYRDENTITWIANRLGVTRPRVRHIIGDAQEGLGYERAYAVKQSTPGKYVSMAQRRAERWREYVRLTEDFSQEEWDVLIDNLPRRVVQALERGLNEAKSDDERRDVEANLLLPHVKDWLRRLGRYFSSSEPDEWDGQENDAADYEANWSALVEDLALPAGTRPEDLPPAHPR